MSQEVQRTYRWRRRQVTPVRWTWLGMVTVLLTLIHQQVLLAHPMGMTGRVGLFIGMVVLPVVLLTLWRAGLLPPERVPYDDEGPR